MASLPEAVNNYIFPDSVTSDAADYVDAIMSSQPINRVEKSRLTKRSLYNPECEQSPKEADNQPATVPPLEQLLAQLSADIHMQFSAMNERIDKMESSLEQKISNKVAQVLDKRINSEMNRIRKDDEISIEAFKEDIRVDISNDLYEMKTKVDALSNSPQSSDVALNVAIRNLPGSDTENIKG